VPQLAAHSAGRDGVEHAILVVGGNPCERAAESPARFIVDGFDANAPGVARRRQLRISVASAHSVRELVIDPWHDRNAIGCALRLPNQPVTDGLQRLPLLRREEVTLRHVLEPVAHDAARDIIP
jgi:hypothetical protein